VHIVDDLKVTERLKLFLLNLAHTCMADRWKAEGRRADETVRELVADPAIRDWLDALYDEELLPVFAAAAIVEAPDYRRSVIDRFRNPFLDHRLSDIIMNHADKKERRVGGFIAWAGDVAPGMDLPRLGAVAASGVG
jgi:tagaturonate reductase